MTFGWRDMEVSNQLSVIQNNYKDALFFRFYCSKEYLIVL